MSINNQGPFEGAFVQPNPVYNPGFYNPGYPVAMGGPLALRAAPGGVIQARFAWADPDTGMVSNIYVSPGQQLGIVIPDSRPGWQRVFFDPTVCAYRIRQGLPVTLGLGGPYWLRFAAGAVASSRVYADPIDGHAISGDTGDGAVSTQWTVSTNCQPGELAIVSTSAKYGA